MVFILEQSDKGGFSSWRRDVYLLVVDKLLANLAGIDSVQTAAAFGWPAVVVRLKAVIDETPLNTCENMNNTLKAQKSLSAT